MVSTSLVDFNTRGDIDPNPTLEKNKQNRIRPSRKINRSESDLSEKQTDPGPTLGKNPAALKYCSINMRCYYHYFKKPSILEES